MLATVNTGVKSESIVLIPFCRPNPDLVRHFVENNFYCFPLHPEYYNRTNFGAEKGHDELCSCFRLWAALDAQYTKGPRDL
jgi:hypothetical protein